METNYRDEREVGPPIRVLRRMSVQEMETYIAGVAARACRFVDSDDDEIRIDSADNVIALYVERFSLESR